MKLAMPSNGSQNERLHSLDLGAALILRLDAFYGNDGHGGVASSGWTFRNRGRRQEGGREEGGGRREQFFFDEIGRAHV